jgi:hypothetical protein
MSSTKYTYSKVVAPDTLEFQIRNSQITVALDNTPGAGIQATPSSVDIWFRATLSSNDESILTALINNHVAIPLLYQGEPTDADGAKIQRPKAAKAGFAFQFHTTEFTTAGMTSSYSGYRNEALNPITRQRTDLGFTTIKFYDENGTQLTEPPQMTNAVWTVVDWETNHDMEIVGSVLLQRAAPDQPVILWSHLAPGIVNYPFMQGGLDLSIMPADHVIDMDGKVSKYLSATLPIPGCNKIRLTLFHPAGYQYTGQVAFMFYKAVTP